MKRRDKKFQERANEIAAYVKQNFDSVRVEEDEEIQLIVASDKASATLSNKRVYFDGSYEGASEDTMVGDVVNLDSVKLVRTKKKMRPYQKYILILFALIILATVAIWKSGIDAFRNEDVVFEQFVAMFFSFLASSVASVLTIASFDFASYKVLQFVCDYHQFGVEIRNMALFDEANKLVLLALQKGKKQPEDNVATHDPDKIGRLSELSKLYEQGLISPEEFERLKREIIN